MFHDRLMLVLVTLWIVATFVHAKTDSQDVSALNSLYTSLNSPSALSGWKARGGDPCDDAWEGITCKGSSVSEIKLPGLKLSGSLGYQLSNLKSTTYLDLSKNKLKENLPYQLPPNLQRLDLSDNEFNGNIPYSIAQMQDLVDLNLGSNQLDGELSDMFQQLQKLETMDLSNNHLRGQLPQSFMNLTNLKTLYLQNNQFKGSINYIRDLPLDNLNVENNQFSGWIPNELKGIDSLKTGGNHWSYGRAPPPPPGTHHRRRDDDNGGGIPTKTTVTIVSIAVGILLMLFLLLTAIAVASKKRAGLSSSFIDEERGSHRSRKTPTPAVSRLPSHAINASLPDNYRDPDPKLEPDAWVQPKAIVRLPSTGGKTSLDLDLKPLDMDSQATERRSLGAHFKEFTLADLQTATAHFAEGRLLGEGPTGRVYRAKDTDGEMLAVKEINPALLEGKNMEEFSSVIASISQVRHRNIAQLVGYCSEQGRYLLVYEYQRNGSIHEFLHLKDDFSKPLTWNTRIRIALGVARAIQYLHEVCSPPLIHKNIKSSNVLLDSDLNPHLSDYGFADFLPHVDERHGVGYKAPECVEPSTYMPKSDIYSFGVVMLEILTGRPPFDSTKPKTEQSLVHWATPQLHDEEALEAMADPALCGLYPLESLIGFADIVSLCVKEEPEPRPTASELVSKLSHLFKRSTSSLTDLLSNQNMEEDSY